MKKFIGQRIVTFLLALVCTMSLCLSQVLAEDLEAVRLEDNYFASINAEWLAQNEIRPDRPTVSAFNEASDSIQKILMADFAAMMASGEDTGDPLLNMFLTYYGMIKDMDKRNADGFAPAAADYARIESLKSLDDLTAQLKDWVLWHMPLPFGIGVAKAWEDVTKYDVHISGKAPLFSDPEYYQPDNQIGQILLSLLDTAQLEMLIATGITQEEARAELDRANEFEMLLASLLPSLEEQADMTRFNNPTTLADFAAYSQHIDLPALVEELIGVRPEMVNVSSPEFFAAFNAVYTPENFETMKSWMKVGFLQNVSSSLGEDLSMPMEVFFMQINGVQEFPDPEESAYEDAYGAFSDVVGRYYGEKYFGPQARENVTGMVENAIEVYRGRLKNNDWLSEATKAMAERKLDTMTIRVGYPEKLPSQYDLYSLPSAEEGGTLYSSEQAIIQAILKDNFQKYGTEAARDEWITPADTVNAFYYPQDNSINFPAGILQAPFYALEQSQSANLGGIGIVIGHEISHAFDANGSRFDEFGNMSDWWTEEDFEEFSARAARMVELFEGRPFAGSAISGQLTLNENIADAGGIACMLDIARTLADASLSDFFASYAAAWRTKATPEYEALLLADTHSPPVLRVNVQCGNSEAFYEAYAIQETDAMYIAPENRVSIW